MLQFKFQKILNSLTSTLLNFYGFWRWSPFYKIRFFKLVFSHIYFWYKNIIDKDELQFCTTSAKNFEIVFDIGANLGWLSKHLAIRNRNLLILACEPFPPNFEILTMNMRTYEKVICLPIALSSRPKTVYLLEDFKSHANTRITSQATEFITQCETIDSLSIKYGSPDLIKIDTQGSEYEILLGGINTITEIRPIIVLEFSQVLPNKNQAIIELLKKKSYIFLTFHGSVVDLTDMLNFYRDTSLVAAPKELVSQMHFIL